jgi:hypothetical protein
MQFSQPFQCPDIDQSQVCCNDDQHNLMAANFKLIDASFGSLNGGCDLCAANLKSTRGIYTKRKMINYIIFTIMLFAKLFYFFF